MRDGTVSQVITNVSAFGFPTGLVGTVGVRVDLDGTNVIPRTTALIDEFPVDSGVYVLQQLTLPGAVGFYQIVWDNGNFPLTPEDVAVEDLAVYASNTPIPFPPPDAGASPLAGPCTAWLTGDDVAVCCSVDEVGTMTELFDNVADSASQALYELSGRRFSGACEKTVRPCGRHSCGFQVLSRGHVIGDVGGWNGGSGCGCQQSDTVLLSGYPVREITGVLIDGDVVDPATYRLDEHRYLRRVRDPAEPDNWLVWPSCQSLDLPNTEDGTFSVSYRYGMDPPLMGVHAASELACELWKACSGSGDCALPSGTTRVIRQGVVIERMAFAAWGLQQGIWRTGLTRVDAFLNFANPTRMTRRPSTYSPDGMQYARTVGQ